jgi:hypothetical protein
LLWNFEVSMLATTRHACRSGFAAAIFLAGLAVSFAAAAENIPAEALAEDQKSCIAACVGRGKPPEKCGAACECTTKAYGEQLTFEEYLALTNAVKQQQEPPKLVLEKMAAITKTCRAKLD